MKNYIIDIKFNGKEIDEKKIEKKLELGADYFYYYLLQYCDKEKIEIDILYREC